MAFIFWEIVNEVLLYFFPLILELKPNSVYEKKKETWNEHTEIVVVQFIYKRSRIQTNFTIYLVNHILF